MEQNESMILMILLQFPTPSSCFTHNTFLLKNEAEPALSLLIAAAWNQSKLKRKEDGAGNSLILFVDSLFHQWFTLRCLCLILMQNSHLFFFLKDFLRVNWLRSDFIPEFLHENWDTACWEKNTFEPKL